MHKAYELSDLLSRTSKPFGLFYLDRSEMVDACSYIGILMVPSTQPLHHLIIPFKFFNYQLIDSYDTLIIKFCLLLVNCLFILTFLSRKSGRLFINKWRLSL